jgi:hypothetical protein
MPPPDRAPACPPRSHVGTAAGSIALEPAVAQDRGAVAQDRGPIYATRGAIYATRGAVDRAARSRSAGGRPGPRRAIPARARPSRRTSARLASRRAVPFHEERSGNATCLPAARSAAPLPASPSCVAPVDPVSGGGGPAPGCAGPQHGAAVPPPARPSRPRARDPGCTPTGPVVQPPALQRSRAVRKRAGRAHRQGRTGDRRSRAPTLRQPLCPKEHGAGKAGSICRDGLPRRDYRPPVCDLRHGEHGTPAMTAQRACA